ncbi:serine/threonine-protein phosphatase 7 long form homolog [Rutidosis leptorrhynchoides]|uniref:serine/threonine-protein phosphatase 7 long form homolog n=1 Tax=Rutidosis leptorrhynchoides TaxID=125765 RepID=UPI003A9A41B5
MSDLEWVPLVAHYLGIHIGEADLETSKIKIFTIITELYQPVGGTAESHQQRARVYMLALLRGVLFPNANSTSVTLRFMYNLLDFSPNARLSWGSAVLEQVYRNLCRSAKNKDNKGINGAMLLVQH